MPVRVSSAESPFERLQRLELEESNLRIGLEWSELKPGIREQLLRLLNRMSEEKARLIELVVHTTAGR